VSSDRERIAVVVVTWNSEEFIERCLTSLRENHVGVAVIVVDNASDDDTAKMVRGFDNVQLRDAGVNLGFAAGNNLALRDILSRSNRPEYVFFLNPDAYVANDAIARLVAYMDEQPQVGVCCPKILHHGSDRVWFAGATIDMRTGVTSHITSISPAPSVRGMPIGRPCGAAMMVRTDVLDLVGVFDERYFLYFEEADWFVRLERAGYSAALVPDAKAWHAVSSSTGGGESGLYHYYMCRNRLLFLALNSDSSPLLGRLRWCVVAFGRDVIRVARRSGPRRAIVIAGAQLLGYWDFAMGRFGYRNGFPSAPNGDDRYQ
jgi:GT2 family glycosyltransferase